MRQLHSHGFLADTENSSRPWLREYIHPEDQAQVTAAIHEAIRTKSTFELEHRVQRADDSLGWTFSRAVPLVDTKGEIVEWFGAASDITERKRAEEAVKERTRQLEAANKELHEFNHTVAHDLRPPLRIIGTFAQMLLKGLDKEFDGDARQKLHSIRGNTQRMNQLLDELLTFTQLNLKSLSLSVIDMEELTKEVWKEQSALNPDREMELRVSALPEAWGDRTLVGQVLANLLSNAVKFLRV